MTKPTKTQPAPDPAPYQAKAMHEQRQREKALRDMEILADLERHKPATGFDVLSAVVYCAGSGVVPPDWLFKELRERFEKVKLFEVASLDHPAAFGPKPDPRSVGAKQLRTAAIKAKYGHMLRRLFSGNLPRTPQGYAEAAAMLCGITDKQVRTALPKMRKNVRGHKPYGYKNTANPAHDPFAQITGKKPKR